LNLIEKLVKRALENAGFTSTFKWEEAFATDLLSPAEAEDLTELRMARNRLVHSDTVDAESIAFWAKKSERLLKTLEQRPRKNSVLTAQRPDVRVRVHTSLVFPGDEAKEMLHVEVQNHSPVVVYMKSVSLLLDDGSGLFAPRDAATGMQQYRRELQPGEGYDFFYSPDMITEKVDPDRIVAAAATEDVGRVYRAEEDETRKAIRQLLSLRKS